MKKYQFLIILLLFNSTAIGGDFDSNIGYFCPPLTSPIQSGSTINFLGGMCTYQGSNLPYHHYFGELFKGPLGNAVSLTSHYLGYLGGTTTWIHSDYDDYVLAKAGDHYFVAIYDNDGGNEEMAALRLYFISGGSPPHSRFGLVSWTWRRGITTRVSVASDGTQGNNDSGSSSISADGRYVAFSSSASNLVPGDTNNALDVFVHDRVTGQTTRVSVASDGSQGNADSAFPSISADGRYVVFVSLANNLVSGDTNYSNDVFVHDRVTGQTTRVSVASDGTQGNNRDSQGPSISADGRYVAFSSLAGNLVSNDTNGSYDVFVHDRGTGQTTRISVASDGTEGDYHSYAPAISADGHFVAFESQAGNLTPGSTLGKRNIYVHDRATGQTTMVSVNSNGTQGNYESANPSISADGRYITFSSGATNLVLGDTNGNTDTFVHDRLSGQTSRVSMASDGTQGQGNNGSTNSSISADGRYVAFDSYALNLVPGDGGTSDVFVHDRVTGQTTKVSVALDGTNGHIGSHYPSISADGRYVAFGSWESNLVPGDTNGYFDTFVHDRGGNSGYPVIQNPIYYGLQTFSGYGPDPVNTATGNYIYQKKDLEIPGQGIPFTFERNYNSQDNQDGPLGFGWNHAYNAKLTVNSDSTVTIRWGDGKTETWTPDGSGGYTPQYGVFDTLIDNGDGTYSLKKKDLTRYNFDAEGKLSSIADKNSNTITATYTGNNLTQITDTVGRNIIFTYDGNNRITMVTDPINRTLQYAYDSNGDLITATDMNGNITTYTYDGNHQILAVVDPKGNTIVTNTYDAQKRVVTSQRDAKGGQTTYAYSDTDRITTITDQMGNSYYHYHDALLRLIQEKDTLGNSAYYTYDSAGNRTQVKDKNGNIAQYTYDARGNVLTKTDALNNVTTITYDANNNPLTRTDALGKTTAFEYDAQGNLTKTTDPLGNFTASTYTINGQPAIMTDARGYQTTYNYDAQGNLLTATDALGNQTQYTYDGVGRKLTQTDALNHTTTYTYDAVGNMVQLRTPNSELYSYTYDGNNNKQTFTDPKGNITRYAYDVKDLLTTITDPLNQTIAYTYDALDRRITETDKRGNTTTYTYDAAGNRIQLRTPNSELFTYTFDANGNKLTETNPLGQTTIYTYDALNRLTSVTDPLGNGTTTAYDALSRITSSTDAKGSITVFAYNPLGRLTTVTDSNGGIVNYTYDANGNRLTQTDPDGQTTSYVYDALNRMTQKVEPLGNTYQYTYDAVGNKTGQTDARGNVITYAYDGNNRLSTINYPDSSTVGFTYDLNGNRIQMVDSLGTSNYTYDSLNRMVTYTNPHGKTVGYGYDANGNKTSLTYPGGNTVTYGFDAMNRLISVTDWGSRTTTYAYDTAGKLTGLLNPNLTTTAYSYDAAGRVTGQANQKSDASVLSSYSFTLDALGNQLSVNKTEPLSPVLTPKNIAYTYDAENRLTQAGSTTNTYDGNGNLITKGSDTFSYDYNDRLIQSSVSGENSQYGYDGLGNRLWKVKNGVTARYVLDVNGSLSNVLAETDGSGTITAYYVHGLGLIAKVLPNGTPYYYHYDSRGSTVALTDSTQNQTDAYAYDSFGSVANSTGSTPNPFKYVGGFGVMDEGNGLKYIRARYYSPELGRFITKDPMTGKDGDSQSLNRYVYALNNPVRLVDVSGFSAKEGGVGQSNSGSSDKLHRPMIDKIKQAKLNSLKAQYDYIAALETEAAYWEAWVNTLEGVSGALNVVGGLLTGGWTSVASGMVTMGGALTQAAGMDQRWHIGANLVSTGLDIYGLASSAQNFHKALDGRTAQARALDLDVTKELTKNMTKTTKEAISMGADLINMTIDYNRMLFEKLF